MMDKGFVCFRFCTVCVTDTKKKSLYHCITGMRTRMLRMLVRVHWVCVYICVSV